MLKKASFLMALLILSIFLWLPALSVAQETEEERTGTSEVPKGFEQGEKKGWKGEDQPSGWEKGEKKGWTEDKPPGLEKRGLSEEQRQEMKKKKHEMREKRREHKREIMQEKREHRQQMRHQMREHRGGHPGGGSHRGR